VAALAAHCEKEGRDPASIAHSLMCGYAVTETEEEARRLLPERARASLEGKNGLDRLPWVFGTPAQVVEQLQALEAEGVSRVMLQNRTPPSYETLAVLAQEVLLCEAHRAGEGAQAAAEGVLVQAGAARGRQAAGRRGSGTAGRRCGRGRAASTSPAVRHRRSQGARRHWSDLALLRRDLLARLSPRTSGDRVGARRRSGAPGRGSRRAGPGSDSCDLFGETPVRR
jgi:hypothetical protein